MEEPKMPKDAMDAAVARVLDIAMKRETTGAPADGDKPEAPGKPEALCDLVVRQVVQHGLKWTCGACGADLRSWDERLTMAVAKGVEVTAQCAKCRAEMRLRPKPENLIITPGGQNRIGVPKLQVQPRRR